MISGLFWQTEKLMSRSKFKGKMGTSMKTDAWMISQKQETGITPQIKACLMYVQTRIGSALHKEQSFSGSRYDPTLWAGEADCVAWMQTFCRFAAFCR